MERFVGNAKQLFEDSIEFQHNEQELTLSIIVKGDKKSKEVLGEEIEIRDMLRMFGGLNEDITMEIDIDEESQKIDLKFQDKDNYIKVRDVLDNIMERLMDICYKALDGDISHFKDLGDFND